MPVVPSWLSELHLELEESGRQTFTLPPDDTGALSVFAVSLFEEFKLRQVSAKKGKRGMAISPNQWLKPHLYQVILAYAHDERLDELEDRIHSYGRYARRAPAEERFFLRGIMALSAHDPKLLTGNNRIRMAREMWHGFRNYIPPQLLNAFNRQYASAKITPDDTEGTIVKELHGWIIRERAKWWSLPRHLETLRGWYPVSIENSVQALLDEERAAKRQRPKSAENDWGEWDDIIAETPEGLEEIMGAGLQKRSNRPKPDHDPDWDD